MTLSWNGENEMPVLFIDSRIVAVETFRMQASCVSPALHPAPLATASHAVESFAELVLPSRPQDICPLDMIPARNGGGFVSA